MLLVTKVILKVFLLLQIKDRTETSMHIYNPNLPGISIEVHHNLIWALGQTQQLCKLASIGFWGRVDLRRQSQCRKVNAKSAKF